MRSLRLLLIEGQTAVAEALALALGSAPDMEVVGLAHTGREGVAADDRLAPDVVVLDLALPDMDGLEVARAIRTSSSAPRLVVLTAHADPARVLGALAAGVDGFVTKSSSLDEVLDVVRKVARGERAMCAEAEAALGERPRASSHPDLTRREMDVLGLLATGITNREIAAQLGLSTKTIETHRARIYAKLNVGSAAAAVRVAIRSGLIQA